MRIILTLRIHVIMICAVHISCIPYFYSPPASRSAPPPAVFCTLDGDHIDRIDPFSNAVDSLWQQHIGGKPICEKILSERAAEGEELLNELQPNKELTHWMGMLYLLQFYNGIPDAVNKAGHYLGKYVELYSYRDEPYLALAMLNLSFGCVDKYKTQYLLSRVQQERGDEHYPYLDLLWGHFFRTCNSDDSASAAHYLSYLAFNPEDELIRERYRALRQRLAEGDFAGGINDESCLE